MKGINVGISESFIDYLLDWNHEEYFIYGGYGSGKSDTTALKLLKLSFEDERLILVTRKVYGTLKDSCYRLLKQVAQRYQMDMFLEYRVSPLYIRNKITGTEFIFKGLDDKEKLKSLPNVSVAWLEECSEFTYDDYQEIRGRLRHPTKSVHRLLTTNPISKSSWIYNHFFKNEKIDRSKIYTHHSTCDDNPFLPSSYVATLDELKHTDEILYRIARLGEFGTDGARVLQNVESWEHSKVLEAISKIYDPLDFAGMDFGFSESYNALIRFTVDSEEKILYITYEYYIRGLTDVQTAIEIKDFYDTGELITADSAEPKTIAFYQQEGFNMRPCKKFPGSRLQNTKKMQRFKKIIISDQCPNCYEELKDLVFKKDRNGNVLPDQFNIDPHSFSAIWYGLDDYEVSSLKGDDIIIV
jgi:phage terminase large subunit